MKRRRRQRACVRFQAQLQWPAKAAQRPETGHLIAKLPTLGVQPCRLHLRLDDAVASRRLHRLQNEFGLGAHADQHIGESGDFQHLAALVKHLGAQQQAGLRIGPQAIAVAIFIAWLEQQHVGVMSSGAIGSERLHVVGLGDVVVTAEQERGKRNRRISLLDQHHPHRGPDRVNLAVVAQDVARLTVERFDPLELIGTFKKMEDARAGDHSARTDDERALKVALAGCVMNAHQPLAHLARLDGHTWLGKNQARQKCNGPNGPSRQTHPRANLQHHGVNALGLQPPHCARSPRAHPARNFPRTACGQAGTDRAGGLESTRQRPRIRQPKHRVAGAGPPPQSATAPMKRLARTPRVAPARLQIFAAPERRPPRCLRPPQNPQPQRQAPTTNGCWHADPPAGPPPPRGRRRQGSGEWKAPAPQAPAPNGLASQPENAHLAGLGWPAPRSASHRRSG